jgi:short-subunit dehydrogenase
VRRLALVTGASAGIGAAFARRYAEAGCDLALTARRADRLEALAAELSERHGVEAFALAADLADPAAPERLVAEVAARGRHVDVLVNNAGYGRAGPFTASDWSVHRDFLQVLTVAPAQLCHLVLPGMVERGYGRILNVASLLGLSPALPDHGLYSAAKAFLVKLSETLHLEGRAAGVHVVAVCPGLTRSEFHAAPSLREAAGRAPALAWMSAEAVAAEAYAAGEENRPVCVPGGLNKVVAAVARLVPETWGLEIADRQTYRARPD